MSPNLHAEIITTGSEIMTGEILDSNAAWLSAFLSSLGISVQRHTSVGDNMGFLKDAFIKAWQDHHVILVTGGLGPTEDDLTRTVASEAFQKPLEIQNYLVENMKAYFQRHGYAMPENNLRQCYLPKDMQSIENPNGTAPGFFYEKENKIIIFMPGVPNETKPMTTNWVQPYLLKKYAEKLGYINNFIIKTAGIGESTLDDKIADLMQENQTNPSISLLASGSETRVVVRCQGENQAQTQEKIQPIINKIEKRLKEFIYGYGEENLASVINKLLSKNKLKLSLTDSVSQGRLISVILPFLNEENCGTFTILNNIEEENNGLPKKRKNNILNLSFSGVQENNGDFELKENEIFLDFKTEIQSEILNNNENIIINNKMGGLADKVLYRASHLCLFNLWKTLQKIEA